MRKGFTLIELMTSIVILSIMMLFLYESYAGLNKSNKTFAVQVQKLSKMEQIKKVIYFDITLAKSIGIFNQSKTEDVLFLQTQNSLHNRINPYVAYIVKEKKLYRLESLKEFKEYPLTADSEFVVDELWEVKNFRIYSSKEQSKNLYLTHVIFEETSEVLLKVKALNKE